MQKTEQMKIRALTYLVTAFVIWGTSHTPMVERYLNQVKDGTVRLLQEKETRGSAGAGQAPEAVPVMARLGGAPASVPTGGELLKQLQEEAVKLRIQPVNARVDPIWKAIPGLNGRELDVEKTYRLAGQLPQGTPLTYIYREVPPKTGLDDLGAQPIYRGNPEKKMISLMINVAWGDEFLPKMLDVLKKENVHATFFLDGTWLKGHLEQAKAIGEAGHELSNHAYSHKNMSQLPRGQAEQEIVKTEKLLEQIGVKNRLFAPPSGDFDQETVDIAHQLKLRTILWTLDTVDWMKPEPAAVIRKITSRLEPGAMILMHPTHASSESIEAIIRDAKKKGYALGTVSELISPERVPELETQLRK
ncbi:polysaccharide deacetylase family protein [Gorillibacterium sp. sgz5001074]|uniref:polysaccharide deacetylase family protein n=1 Tax=Gorillibacterium sp. sgz5001074 TaxID=3446695 RepID=UPI003F664F6C